MKPFLPLIMFLIVLMAFTTGCASMNPADQEDSLPQTQQAQPNPGAEPQGSVPVLGILVLLAPAVWMVWQAYREKKLKKVRAACCVPVMDEDQPGMGELK